MAVDELGFASDFYYSPIPLCIFGGWCAALNYICSLLIIVGAVAVRMDLSGYGCDTLHVV